MFSFHIQSLTNRDTFCQLSQPDCVKNFIQPDCEVFLTAVAPTAVSPVYVYKSTGPWDEFPVRSLTAGATNRCDRSGKNRSIPCRRGSSASDCAIRQNADGCTRKMAKLPGPCCERAGDKEVAKEHTPVDLASPIPLHSSTVRWKSEFSAIRLHSLAARRRIIDRQPATETTHESK